MAGRFERCGDYAECWEYLGKPKGWLGCSLPRGHAGCCGDEAAHRELCRPGRLKEQHDTDP